jgi:phosphopantetheinyl transferase
MAAVAVASRPCGVDVEHERRDLKEGAGMGSRILSPAERHRLRPLSRDARRRSMLQSWCVKEALLKGTGRGLADDPWALELPPWSGDGPLPEIPGMESWRAWGFRARTGHLVGVAVEDRADPRDLDVHLASSGAGRGDPVRPAPPTPAEEHPR